MHTTIFFVVIITILFVSLFHYKKMTMKPHTKSGRCFFSFNGEQTIKSSKKSPVIIVLHLEEVFCFETFFSDFRMSKNVDGNELTKSVFKKKRKERKAAEER